MLKVEGRGRGVENNLGTVFMSKNNHNVQFDAAPLSERPTLQLETTEAEPETRNQQPARDLGNTLLPLE